MNESDFGSLLSINQPRSSAFCLAQCVAGISSFQLNRSEFVLSVWGVLFEHLGDGSIHPSMSVQNLPGLAFLLSMKLFGASD